MRRQRKRKDYGPSLRVLRTWGFTGTECGMESVRVGTETRGFSKDAVVIEEWKSALRERFRLWWREETLNDFVVVVVAVVDKNELFDFSWEEDTFCCEWKKFFDNEAEVENGDKYKDKVFKGWLWVRGRISLSISSWRLLLELNVDDIEGLPSVDGVWVWSLSSFTERVEEKESESRSLCLGFINSLTPLFILFVSLNDERFSSVEKWEDVMKSTFKDALRLWWSFKWGEGGGGDM